MEAEKRRTAQSIPNPNPNPNSKPLNLRVAVHFNWPKYGCLGKDRHLKDTVRNAYLMPLSEPEYIFIFLFSYFIEGFEMSDPQVTILLYITEEDSFVVSIDLYVCMYVFEATAMIVHLSLF